MGEGWKELFSWPTSGEARHFVGGWEKHHGRYYRSRGLGSFGAAGRQDGWQSPNRCLRHAVFTQRGKQRNTAGSMASLSQPLPKRACSAILLPSRTSGNPWAVYRVRGGGLGTRPNNPSHFPALPRELRLPLTGAGPGSPMTQGAATAPFIGFGWKLHPEAPLPALQCL